MTAHAGSRSAAAPRGGAAPVALVLLVFGIVVLALYGAELAAGAFRSGAGVPPANAVGLPVRTSFGLLTVEHAQAVDGPAAGDMWNGMTKGIEDLVQPGDAQVGVGVLVVNEGGRAVPVEPGQFGLVIEGRTDPVLATGGTIVPLRLRPGSGIRGTLVFVVPLGTGRASIVYQDPAGTPLTIPVGTLDGSAPPPAPQHEEGMTQE